MTTAERDDIYKIKKAIKIGNFSDPVLHRPNTQATFIDIKILEGKSTIEEIAMALNARETRKQPLKKRIIRVADHIAHLQEGDSRGRANNQKPHGLSIKKDSQNRLSFDL